MARYYESYTTRYGDTIQKSGGASGNDNTALVQGAVGNANFVLSNDVLTISQQGITWDGEISGTLSEWVCFDKTIKMEAYTDNSDPDNPVENVGPSFYVTEVPGYHQWFVNCKFFIGGARELKNAQRIGTAQVSDGSGTVGKRPDIAGTTAANRAASSTSNFINCTFTILGDAGDNEYGTIVPGTMIDCVFNYIDPDTNSLIVVPCNNAEVDTLTLDSSTANDARTQTFEIFTEPDSFSNVNVIGAQGYMGVDNAGPTEVEFDGFSLVNNIASTDNTQTEADLFTIADFNSNSNTNGLAMNQLSPKFDFRKNGQIRWRSINSTAEQNRNAVIVRQNIQRKYFTDTARDTGREDVYFYANTEVDFELANGVTTPPATDASLSKTERLYISDSDGDLYGDFDFDGGRVTADAKRGTSISPIKLPVEWLRTGALSNSNNYTTTLYDLETDFTELSLYGTRNTTYTRNSGNILTSQSEIDDNDGYHLPPDISLEIVDPDDTNLTQAEYDTVEKIRLRASGTATDPGGTNYTIDTANIPANDEIAFYDGTPTTFTNGRPTDGTQVTDGGAWPEVLSINYADDDASLFGLAEGDIMLLYFSETSWAVYWAATGDALSSGSTSETRVYELVEATGTVNHTTGDTYTIETQGGSAPFADIENYSIGSLSPNDIYAQYKRWTVLNADSTNYPVDNVSNAEFDFSAAGIDDLNLSNAAINFGGRVPADDTDALYVACSSLESKSTDIVTSIKANNIGMGGKPILANVNAVSSIHTLNRFSALPDDYLTNDESNTAKDVTLGGAIKLSTTGSNRIYVFNGVAWDGAVISRDSGNLDDIIYFVGGTPAADGTDLTVTQPDEGSITVRSLVRITINSPVSLTTSDLTYNFSQSTDGSTFTDVPAGNITISIDADDDTIAYADVEFDVTNASNELYYAISAETSTIGTELIRGNITSDTEVTLVSIEEADLNFGTALGDDAQDVFDATTTVASIGSDTAAITATVDLTGQVISISSNEARRFIRERVENNAEYMRAVARGYVATDYFQYTAGAIVLPSDNAQLSRLSIQRTLDNDNTWTFNSFIENPAGTSQWNTVSTTTPGTLINFAPSTDGMGLGELRDELDNRYITRANVGNIGALKPIKDTNGDIYTGD